MAPAGPKVDDDSYRALHDPLHHHAHRQVSPGSPLISLTHFSPFLFPLSCTTVPDATTRSSSFALQVSGFPVGRQPSQGL